MKKIINGKFKYNLFESKGQKKTDKIVLFYHGWGTTADGYSDIAEKIKLEGYTVIVPELIYHDTRNPLETPFEPKVSQNFFWKVVIKSIEEFNEFVYTVGINKKNIILVGSSMGGFIANGIFARETNVFGLANINGSGSFVLSEKNIQKI